MTKKKIYGKELYKMENNGIKGGIVALKLDYNGYVKFANGFTIQWVESTGPVGTEKRKWLSISTGIISVEKGMIKDKE